MGVGAAAAATSVMCCVAQLGLPAGLASVFCRAWTAAQHGGCRVFPGRSKVVPAGFFH